MRNSVDLLTFELEGASVDTPPSTLTDELEAARSAHAKAEAAEVRARAAYEAAIAAKIKVLRDSNATREVVRTIRAAYDRAREDLASAFRSYAASARSLAQARPRDRLR